jgi:hypothetical protein
MDTMTDRPSPEIDLTPITIHLLDQNGTHSYLPNDLMIAFIRDKLHETLKPIEGLSSICSGEPAVVYRTSETELALTPDEVRRLTFHSLNPQEFKAIRDKAGDIYELHDDFYDEATGEAIDPFVPMETGPRRQ